MDEKEKTKISCPKCESLNNRVKMTAWQEAKSAVRRYRYCAECKETFVTWEIHHDRLERMERMQVFLSVMVHKIRFFIDKISDEFNANELFEPMSLTEDEASDLMGVKVATLRQMRSRKVGPPFVCSVVGYQRIFFYSYPDIIEYMESKHAKSKTEPKAEQEGRNTGENSTV